MYSRSSAPLLRKFNSGGRGMTPSISARIAPRETKVGKATIVSDPEALMGKPVVAGTRITVEYILEELAHGQPIKALVHSHPTLTREGVLAALEYAAKVMRLDSVDPIDAP